MHINIDRYYWINTMRKIADPVLEALSTEQLRKLMPVESPEEGREVFSHLEAFGRLVAGMAPWIETGPRSGEEGELRKRYADMIRKCIEVGTDPKSPDYFNFSEGSQPLVDASYVAHAIVRAPNELYEKLPKDVKRNLIHSFKKTRQIRPVFNNWLLFAAMIETALYIMEDDSWDRMRIDYALRQHEQWYLGDGIYSDGKFYHADYYNSFVIHPYLVDIINTVGDEDFEWVKLKGTVNDRAKRYATILERHISPEGTFPVVGRSMPYRTGAFQNLAQMALQKNLDATIKPAQVRCALTAVLKRVFEAEGTFDENGWLRIGISGHQPEMAEEYVSTGSLYICATVFVALGLEEKEAYWQGKADWTAKKAWAGEKVARDEAYD